MRIIALISTALLACLALVGEPVFANEPGESANKEDPVVSPLLRQFIQERETTTPRQGPRRDTDTVPRGRSAERGTSAEPESKDSDTTSTDSDDDPVRFDSSGRVQVYIHLEDTGDATLAQLRGLGATIEVTNYDLNVVQGWVRLSALDRVAALAAVREITAPDYGETEAGRVTTEGGRIHRADLVRQFSDISGSGVKVGVISDGVDRRRTAAASRDLPSDIEVDPDRPGSGDEGTALLEIVHDLAPNAKLAFSGPDTSLEMAQSILWLANDAFGGEGADIIVDDLAYYTEPFFEDGALAKAAADAVAGGAVFVSSAGNNADRHYDGQFVDGGDGFHDFDSDPDATDVALRVSVGVRVVLQWNDEFGSSGNDYDLFICPPGLKPTKFNLQNDVCDGSARGQDGDDNPRESVYTRGSGFSVADLYIRRFSGDAKRLKLFVTRGAVLEHGVREGTITGHEAVADVLAVGAINASDPGNDDAQSYSDRGPVDIYFPSRETRNKPDVMGIDGVLITGAGNFGRPIEGSTNRRFYGTSAAAPHVAGIAALVMEAQRKADPSMKKKQVADAVTQKIRDTAIDLGESGHDNTFGYGRADAFAAIESIAGGSTTFELYSTSRYAETLTVDSTGDGADADTTDGMCDDGNGNCTLRAAIQQANAGTGAIIEFGIPAAGVQTISPTSTLPLVTVPVFIDGYSQPGARAGTVLIELDGTDAGTDVDGLEFKADDNIVRGLAVNSFSRYGIVVKKRTGTLQQGSSRHVLAGNMIGTDTTGSVDEGNGSSGVHLNIASEVLLRDNVISGNGRHGVETTIGGRIHIFGNKIGTNAVGTSDLGNTLAGVSISSRSVVLRDNVISGNDTHGVLLDSNVTEDAVIEYNRIGTNDAGTAALANTGSGIFIDGDPEDNLIAKNIISGNGSHGISLEDGYGGNNLIAENWIGTNANGTDLGNGGSGVHIKEDRFGGPDDNTVEDNTIAFNGGDGVTVVGDGTTGNTIWENSIHGNDGQGIDLGDDGPTANDAADADTGPNHLQNYPANITFASRGDVASLRFSLSVQQGRLYIVDFYSCDSSTSGEGKEWLGFSPLRGSRTGDLVFSPSTFEGTVYSFTAPTDTHVTAVATDTVTDSTSEFAPCVARVALPELVISETDIEVSENGTTTYTVALSSLPSADATVTLTAVDTSVATLSTTTLTFTTTDGTTAQTVSVAGVSDDDAINESTAIIHEVSIATSSYPTAVLPLRLIDEDAPVLTLASTETAADFPADVSTGHFFDGTIGGQDTLFEEGATSTYTVVLDEEPPGDVTISLASSDTDVLTVSPASLTFTRTGEASDPDEYEWNDPQAVILTAVGDTDAADELEIVSHKTTIRGKDYVVGRVGVVIWDTAFPALTFEQQNVEITEITVSENATTTYTVKPASEPASDLTIRPVLTLTDESSTVIVSFADAISVEPASLEFTVGPSGNWQTPQTVTVTGLQDDDGFDDPAAIWHATRHEGEDYNLGRISVTVTDTNRAPFFEDGLETTREVREDSDQGDNVGAPITATDLNAGDTLTYTLDDPSGKFAIGTTTGQLILIADDSLDYETEQDYSMEVAVTDRSSDGLTDKIEVKVLVSDVNEPPTISGTGALSFRENTATTTVLSRYTASDPERGTISWSVGGTDGGAFSIDAGGNLRFSELPDYETQDEYEVTVIATDDGVPSQAGSYPITVEITDVDEPPEIAGLSALTFAENTSTTTVLQAYSASDPEGVTTSFTWSLGGADSGDFDISAAGDLTFKNVPDYDRPADSGGDSVYNVQVRANDGSKTGSLDVTVTVTNVNEPPSTPTGKTAIEVAENTTGNLARYTTTDPDAGDTVRWDLSGTDADDFRIDSSGNLAFDGAPDHETPGDSGGDNVYEVNVDAKDADFTSSLPVTVTVTPVDEPPVITGVTTIDDYDENGTGAVATYAAVDPEGATTTFNWTLGGADRADFDITGGVLAFKNVPDHERPADSGGNNQYEVTVYAADPNNNRGELHVDVIVKDVDEPPEITGPDTFDDFPENSATSRQVGRYTATDPEEATVTLTLTGTDSGEFTLASNGVLTFRQSPDYEAKTSYSVTVRAQAGSHTVNKPVTVNIQNVEEPGTVTLSGVQPQENTQFTATLEDDDGPTTTSWQWYRTSSRGNAGTAISNADSQTYAPVADDVGSYLRVVASYDDGYDTGNTASAVSVNRALAVNPDNVRPVFPADGVYERSIRENLPAGRNLGAPITATDGNADRLTYSIPASDYFEIVDSTGQLRTRAVLDHEDQDEHTVTVTATDPGNLTVSVSVTVTVENMDETPVVSGPTSPEVAEGGGTAVATYTSTDPDRKGVDWVLTGADSDAFTLSGSGALAFREVPDFEEPTDSNRDSRYQVTLEAREQGDGTSVGRLSVTVSVINVDEPGTLETNVEEPRVGETVRLNVEDEDGGERVTEWKWERGEPTSPCGTVDSPTVTTWETITSARSGSYTPTAADQGQCIRATAFYNDRAGTGRTEQFLTPNSVEVGPFFTQEPPSYSVRENTPEGRDIGRVQARHSNSGETLTYTMGGADAVHFTIDDNGRLKTSATPLDYESQPVPEAVVEITAEDNNGRTATISVTVNVTDECASAGEPPCAPGRPSVSSVSTSSLKISWSAPGTPSGTAITDYEIQYRESDGGGSWTSETVTGTDRSHTIENLVEGATYEVQVRARNDTSGYGEWSASGTGAPGTVSPPPIIPRVTTGGGGGGGGGFAALFAPVNNEPSFIGGTRTTRTVPEDAEPGADIGNPVTATDTDDDDLTYTLHGDDAQAFAVQAATGQLRTRAALDFEVKTTYVLEVQVDDGNGGVDSIQVTVTVTDVNEQPMVSGPAMLEYAENGIDPVAAYTASDPEGRDLTWSLTGADAEAFSLSATGTLAFERPPDYETPDDADTDNRYRLTVQATDAGGALGTLNVEIAVTDDEDESIIRQYDTDRNGVIDRGEVLAAAFDYFQDLITKEEVYEVVNTYFTVSARLKAVDEVPA